jgi:hypothetical protein
MAEDVAQDMQRVLVAVRGGKLENGEVHAHSSSNL